MNGRREEAQNRGPGCLFIYAYGGNVGDFNEGKDKQQYTQLISSRSSLACCLEEWN
jgi:hypothetical protein